ncbi:helix-turn-helix domain-containing protein [Porphyrobacter algicida]|uniref:Helix-turn-helix domain-containing protein n=2 Tax=Qipengyuania algicida TaxID=1836209 RepID=A0A845AKX8_9SPHN|nr:helix-turn-helix domain-containing protein [Qipengyuania algicida]
MVRRLTTPGFRDDRYRQLIANLAARRAELGMSQQQLGDKLGLHRQFISRVELGERRLDVVELVDIARALDLDPAEVVAAIPLDRRSQAINPQETGS